MEIAIIFPRNDLINIQQLNNNFSLTALYSVSVIIIHHESVICRFLFRKESPQERETPLDLS